MSAFLSYEPFLLPFLPNVVDDASKDGGEEDELSKEDQLEKMQDQIPGDVVFLGEIGNEIDHSPGMSWLVEDYYYLMPWKGGEYDWALFRISWDDNWGRYDWTMDARIRDVADPKKAARQMITGLLESWGVDLKERDNAPYKRFLKTI